MNSAKVDGVHKEFQKAVRAGVCRFIPDTGNLMLISTDDASQKKGRMIQEMHFRNLSQKVQPKKIDLIIYLNQRQSKILIFCGLW